VVGDWGAREREGRDSLEGLFWHLSGRGGETGRARRRRGEADQGGRAEQEGGHGTHARRCVVGGGSASYVHGVQVPSSYISVYICVWCMDVEEEGERERGPSVGCTVRRLRWCSSRIRSGHGRHTAAHQRHTNIPSTDAGNQRERRWNSNPPYLVVDSGRTGSLNYVLTL
jgi:hypothetical protein